MVPLGSSVTPGISLLPRTRGPIPERKSKLPTRLACGNAPTGSGARELSNVSLINLGRISQILAIWNPSRPTAAHLLSTCRAAVYTHSGRPKSRQRCLVRIHFYRRTFVNRISDKIRGCCRRQSRSSFCILRRSFGYLERVCRHIIHRRIGTAGRLLTIATVAIEHHNRPRGDFVANRAAGASAGKRRGHF